MESSEYWKMTIPEILAISGIQDEKMIEKITQMVIDADSVRSEYTIKTKNQCIVGNDTKNPEIHFCIECGDPIQNPFTCHSCNINLSSLDKEDIEDGIGQIVYQRIR